MQTPVTESDFSIQLKCLNHKLNLIKELQFKDAKSTNDMKGILSKLKIKAMSKIRVYLLEQIYKFRKPMTNYQVPQNVMLKNKFFFEFILSNERQVGQEICNEYVDTMSKIYYSYFKVKFYILKFRFYNVTNVDSIDKLGNYVFLLLLLLNRAIQHDYRR